MTASSSRSSSSPNGSATGALQQQRVRGEPMRGCLEGAGLRPGQKPWQRLGQGRVARGEHQPPCGRFGPAPLGDFGQEVRDGQDPTTPLRDGMLRALPVALARHVAATTV